MSTHHYSGVICDRLIAYRLMGIRVPNEYTVQCILMLGFCYCVAFAGTINTVNRKIVKQMIIKRQFHNFFQLQMKSIVQTILVSVQSLQQLRRI